MSSGPFCWANGDPASASNSEVEGSGALGDLKFEALGEPQVEPRELRGELEGLLPTCEMVMRALAIVQIDNVLL